MSYGENLVNGFKCLFFDQQAMADLAGDESATGHGFLTLTLLGLIYGLIGGVVAMAFAGPLGLVLAIIGGVLTSIVGFIIGYSIYHFLAKLFGGEATGSEYFRVTANFMIVSVFFMLLGLVPVVGQWLSWIVQLWMLVVLIVILKAVHKLVTWKAVLVALIPLIVFGALLSAMGISLLATGL